MLPCHPSYGFWTATWEDWRWGQGNNSFVLTTTNVYMSIWSRLELAPRSPSKVVIILYHYCIENRRGRSVQWKYLMVKLWWSEVTLARERWRTRAGRQIYKSRKRWPRYSSLKHVTLCMAICIFNTCLIIIRRLIFRVTTNKWLKFPARVCPTRTSFCSAYIYVWN
jgi:hypothetical protein